MLGLTKSVEKKVEETLRGRVEQANYVWDRLMKSKDNRMSLRFMEIYQAMDGCNRADWAYLTKMGSELFSQICTSHER
jgi:hypothetical protein